MGRGVEIAVGEGGGGLGHAVGVTHRRPAPQAHDPDEHPQRGEVHDDHGRRGDARRRDDRRVAPALAPGGVVTEPRVLVITRRRRGRGATAMAALRPLMAMTLPPGWVDAPHR